MVAKQNFTTFNDLKKKILEINPAFKIEQKEEGYFVRNHNYQKSDYTNLFFAVHALQPLKKNIYVYNEHDMAVNVNTTKAEFDRHLEMNPIQYELKIVNGSPFDFHNHENKLVLTHNMFHSSRGFPGKLNTQDIEKVVKQVAKMNLNKPVYFSTGNNNPEIPLDFTKNTTEISRNIIIGTIRALLPESKVLDSRNGIIIDVKEYEKLSKATQNNFEKFTENNKFHIFLNYRGHSIYMSDPENMKEALAEKGTKETKASHYRSVRDDIDTVFGNHKENPYLSHIQNKFRQKTMSVVEDINAQTGAVAYEATVFFAKNNITPWNHYNISNDSKKEHFAELAAKLPTIGVDRIKEGYEFARKALGAIPSQSKDFVQDYKKEKEFFENIQQAALEKANQSASK
jgi:hypothetical protein